MNCVINGKLYEQQVWKICTKIKLNKKKFCTINKNKLGNNHDIICNNLKKNDLFIEIKKYNTPDWMQLSIKPNKNGIWKSQGKNKIPDKSKILIEKLIKNINIFNSKIPKFFYKKITHDEWKVIKKETNDFNDMYINCPNNTISKLYTNKGCSYIQISKYGLFHLNNDICNFNVSLFKCKQILRIRTKIHTKCDKDGYMRASVIISPKPFILSKSKYSLDNINNLPTKLLLK
jgi:hypothetical protein